MRKDGSDEKLQIAMKWICDYVPRSNDTKIDDDNYRERFWFWT